MKKLMLVVKVLFVVGLIAWSAYKFNPETAKNVLAAADLKWGIAAIAMNLFVFLFTTLRWRALIRGFCPQAKPSLFFLLNTNLLSVFYVLFIPTTVAIEVVRVLKLKSRINNDYKTATITAALDRMTGVLTWFLLFMLFPSPFHDNRLWLLFLAGIAAAYFLRKRFVFWGHAVFDLTKHHPFDIAKVLCYSFIGQLSSGAVVYSLFKCLGVGIPAVETMGITATISLASMVPISMLGVGAREGSFIGLLPMYGVSATQAVMLMSMLVFLNYLFGLLGGFIELWQSGWDFSKLKMPAKTDENGKD